MATAKKTKKIAGYLHPVLRRADRLRRISTRIAGMNEVLAPWAEVGDAHVAAGRTMLANIREQIEAAAASLDKFTPGLRVEKTAEEKTVAKAAKKAAKPVKAKATRAAKPAVGAANGAKMKITNAKQEEYLQLFEDDAQLSGITVTGPSPSRGKAVCKLKNGNVVTIPIKHLVLEAA